MNGDNKAPDTEAENKYDTSSETESSIEKTKQTIGTNHVKVMAPMVNTAKSDDAVSLLGVTEINKAEKQNDQTISSSEGLGVVHSVGHLLRNARQEQNLTVEDVARQLRLSVQQIERIEKEDYDKLPGRVFLRGFVRNYANLLQLDPAPIIQLLPNQSPTISPIEKTPFKIKEISFSSDHSRNSNGLFLVGAMLILIALVAYFVYPTDGLWSNAEEQVSIPIETDDGQTSIELTLPLSSISSETNNAASTQFNNDELLADTPVTTLNSDGRLYFNFVTQAHVKVIDGHDNTIFDQTTTAGSNRIISGKRPLFVVIHQAKGVELTYNDRPIEIEPYVNEQDGVARFTLE